MGNSTSQEDKFSTLSLQDQKLENKLSTAAIQLSSFTSEDLLRFASSSKKSVVLEIVLGNPEVITEEMKQMFAQMDDDEDSLEAVSKEFKTVIDFRLFAASGNLHNRLFQTIEYDNDEDEEENVAAPSSTSSPAENFPPGTLEIIPVEVLESIACFGNFREVVHSWQLVNKKFYQIANSAHVWKSQTLSSFSPKEEQLAKLYHSPSWQQTFRRLYSCFYTSATVSAISKMTKKQHDSFKTGLCFQFKVSNATLKDPSFEQKKEKLRQSLAAFAEATFNYLDREEADERPCITTQYTVVDGHTKMQMTILFRESISWDPADFNEKNMGGVKSVIYFMQQAKVFSSILNANGVLQDMYSGGAREMSLTFNSSMFLKAVGLSAKSPEYYFEGHPEATQDFREFSQAFAFLDFASLWNKETCVTFWMSNPAAETGYRAWEIMNEFLTRVVQSREQEDE